MPQQKQTMNHEITVKGRKLTLSAKPHGKRVGPHDPDLMVATRPFHTRDGEVFPSGTEYRPIFAGADNSRG